MRTYFVVASEPNVGLTSVSLGLVRALQRLGLKVAFVKPVTKGDPESEPSVRFARSVWHRQFARPAAHELGHRADQHREN